MRYREVSEEQKKFFLYSFRKYGNLIHNYLISKIGRIDDIEDIMQEIFVKLWRTKNSNITTEKSIRKYFIFLANQCIADYYRKHRMEVALSEEEIETEEDKIAIATYQDGLKRRLIASDIVERLRDRISSDDFIILYCRLAEGLSFGEIADMLGIKVRSVRYQFNKTQAFAKDFIKSITKKGVEAK